MQDHSHKLLFLGLTALMSAAAFYGSEAGPTLLLGNDAAAPPAVSAALTAHDARASLDRTDRTKAPFAAKLTVEGTCSGGASDVSPLCPARSKISLSSP